MLVWLYTTTTGNYTYMKRGISEFEGFKEDRAKDNMKESQERYKGFRSYKFI